MNAIPEFALISAMSFFFGVTQKLADGHHEHGLNFFPGAGIVFGVLFGGFGFYLIGYSPVLQPGRLGTSCPTNVGLNRRVRGARPANIKRFELFSGKPPQRPSIGDIQRMP